MNAVLPLFQAFGITAPAGLNAYLTLLVVGLMARTTDLIKLNQPFDIISNQWVLLALATMLFVEVFVDKIPGVDTINDIISTVIRPVAGAVLFAGSNNLISDMNPIVAMIAGLLVAGSVHVVKATVRPAVTVSTGGLGNALVSTAEDAIALVVTVLAIVLPILGVVAFIVLFTLLVLWYLHRRQWRLVQT
ncbi:MAG: DUF4126 domain-containing protein [Dehalococcoidia bacterium]|nr:DUF4126 domain-containing protein [Dehalococcoidia bacterium]